MKKIISALLIILMLSIFTLVPVAALTTTGKTVIEINNDIAGLDENDADSLIHIKSGNVVLDEDRGVFVYYCTNERLDGKMQAGRTYNIEYTFRAEDGYVLPEVFGSENTEVICGEKCKVNYITRPVDYSNGNNIEYLVINTSVTVKGNVFQNIFGWLQDLILKIKFWAPY